ncbi:50S ribosomal protein L9 [Candidatus Methylomirabilis sp.]|uniref:50S ribosomal protein L9 n=1 Tax=Candidatus Methylomirabilis sp. TaxID=2032687 RepID=UPI002A5EABB6|nr:50S ribosomal protein L9 [Candidatus Methylomirabilis sp.]
MKIVLLERVEKVGSAGDQVEVADGFARNFLIPARKAVAATSANIKSLDHLLRRSTEREARLRGTAETMAGRITEIHCVIARRAGEQDRLFGAVTNQDICAALTIQGLEVDRRKILLQEPIKTLGNYTVPIRLHPEVVAELRLTVERAEG